MPGFRVDFELIHTWPIFLASLVWLATTTFSFMTLFAFTGKRMKGAFRLLLFHPKAKIHACYSLVRQKNFIRLYHATFYSTPSSSVVRRRARHITEFTTHSEEHSCIQKIETFFTVFCALKHFRQMMGHQCRGSAKFSIPYFFQLSDKGNPILPIWQLRKPTFLHTKYVSSACEFLLFVKFESIFVTRSKCQMCWL